MVVRRLDANGDIVTSGVQFITGPEEVAQTITTRLKLFEGEYFRDITDGTAWFGGVFSKTTSLSTKDAIIKRRVSQTLNVTQILNYKTDYDIDTRQYTVNGEVLTPYGRVALDVGDVIR